MSLVVLKTSLGDADLELTPSGYNDDVVKYFQTIICKNMGKGQFERVEKGFVAQYTIPNLPCRPFDAPRNFKNKHSQVGTVGVAVINGQLAPGFYITLSERVKHLDEVGYVIGHVCSKDILQMISKCFVDSTFKPLKPIVVFSAIVDGEEVGGQEEKPSILDNSPKEDKDNEDRRWEREQRLRLQLLGDRRAGNIKDSKDIRTIFVAQLSPHTREEDLMVVFSRFGTVTDCQVVRRQGRVSTFAFIQFEQKEDCDEAVRKMDGVILDDRRIKVDYSHSR